MMASSKQPITLVTGNKKKLEEFVAILGKDFPFEVCVECCSFHDKDAFKVFIYAKEMMNNERYEF